MSDTNNDNKKNPTVLIMTMILIGIHCMLDIAKHFTSVILRLRCAK